MIYNQKPTSEMEAGEKMDESCRLCDENSDQMFSIFEKNEDGIQILQLIKECLPIVVSIVLLIFQTEHNL